MDYNGLKNDVARLFETIKRDPALSDCQSLGEVFSRGEKELREHVQEQTKSGIRQIIAKLERDETLDEQQLKLMRLWIVGDAEYYIQEENNFADWMAELERIVDLIGLRDVVDLDVESAARLRSIMMDGKRVVYDISLYLECQERARNFEKSVQQLSAEDRQILVQLLRNKMDSKEF